MKQKLVTRLLAFFFLSILASISFNGFCQTTPSDIVAKLDAYNVSWTTPSTTGSAGSMPIGNGDITSNVWVEKDGDLMLYLGKSDNWSEGTRMLKTGRVRISILPNPFLTGNSFKQELNLHKGEMNVSAGATGSMIKLKIWVDANHPVIHVEATGDQKFSMKCKTEIMRPLAYTLPSATDPLAHSFLGVRDGVLRPTESADIVLSGDNVTGWYHRNTSSLFSTILTNENLGTMVNSFADPYLNRTFGAIVKGDGMIKADDLTLQTSADVSNCSLSIYSYTAQTNTLEEWESQFNTKIAETEAIPLATAYTSHGIWWDNFWSRSWVFITGDAAATSVTQGYLLQRYMMACMSRGKHPVKFNGGSLTFDYNGKNGDFRQWGPGYWNQNVRHLYWPMMSGGDFDLMMPWFDCYLNMIPIQKAFTQKLYNHDGALFPETFNFFGLNILDDWGWGNTDNKTINPYIRYHYSGALEVISQMLDYYYFTKDPVFLNKYIVPFSTEAIRFFDKHFPKENGIIKFYPANALETYWDCTNPTDIVAGLQYVIPKLCSLPENAISSDLKAEWTNCLNSLPPIAFDAEALAVKPAEIAGNANNSEDPDCYSIFPYKIYVNGRENIDIGIETYANRKEKKSTCWAPDPIWAALVGMTDNAKQYVTDDSKSLDANVRFPAFWAPRNDYMPDLDNGGAMMTGVQSMLLQNVDSLIRVLPSWPSTWNVDYKLQAFDNTTVRLISTGQTINQIDVLPSNRLKDVVLPNGKQNQSLIMSPFPVTKPGAKPLTNKAFASSKLPVTYLSSDTTVAKVSGTSIVIVGKGTSVITAFQTGNELFNPSPRISRKLVVSSQTYKKIEAETFTGQSGIETENSSESGQDVTRIDGGDYTFYKDVSLTNVSNIELRVASSLPVGSSAGSIEIRTGSITGPILGEIEVKGTGGAQIWTTISCPITSAKGTQVVYLMYKNNCNFNLNWLQTLSFPTGIENRTKQEYRMKLFPNPAEKNCQIQLTNPDSSNGDLTLNIYSIQGKLINSSIYRSQPGSLEVSVNTSAFQSGIYLVDCTWKDGCRKTEKLMIK